VTRGAISDADVTLHTPLPTSANVPGLFLDDPLYMALCAAFDELLAPIAIALDCLPAYLDPAQTPDDFLPWLAALVGASADRGDIAGAVAGYGLRGTAAGLRSVAASAAGVAIRSVDINDPGGVTWSSVAGSGANRRPVNGPVTVRVHVAPGTDLAAITAAVEVALEPVRPLHCRLQVEAVTK
jgi:phage tail-like protein